MSTRFIPTALRATALMLALLLLAGGNLRADSYTVSYGNGPGVSVNYTNPFPPPADVTGQGTMAVPFSVLDNTTGSSFTGFCIDLYHDQYNNQTYSANAGLLAATSPGTLASIFPYSAYTSDLANKLNYLGYVFGQLAPTGNSDALGAIQLAIWTVIDKEFSYSTGDGTLQTYTTTLVGLIGAPGANGTGGTIDGVTLTAYSTSTNYGSYDAQLIVSHATPQGAGYNQNVITWGQNINITSLAPEPSSFALAGLGAMGLIGYGLRRRTKA